MPEKPDRKTEGHRIHVFINLMKGCGCAFDSGEIPTFLKRGPLEFWEGTFQYAPGGVAIKGKVTLDHDFITLRTEAPMPREEVRRHREAIHLLLTDNGVHYTLEPDPRERQLWLVEAARIHYGSCDRCGRYRSDDDRPLLIARRERARHFLCFACWLETRGRRRR